MRFRCCLPLKKGKRSKKNRKESKSTRQGFTTTTTEPIKNINATKNDITDKEKEFIPLKDDFADYTTENIVPTQDGNTSLDTSVAAVTALSYAQSTEDHSYYVIDHTNVSSLERDVFQDKYDSLQMYSPSTSAVPSIHSNRKSLTEFQSAISLESTESFFTTASYNDDTDTNHRESLSKRISGISTTNYTHDKLIRVLSNKRISATPSYFQSRKSFSFLSLKRSKSKINKDNNNTDTNATVNNFLDKITKDNEETTHTTDITVNNLIVVSNTNISDTTNNKTIPRDINKTTKPDINNTISSLEKDDSQLPSSDVTPFLSKQSSTTKPSSSSSTMGKTKSETNILNSKDLDDIAERALHPDLTNYTLDAVIKNRIKVYTRVRPSTGINEYIILGYLDKVTLREAYEVYMDLEYRKEWDDLKQQISLFNRKDKQSSESLSKNDLKDFEIHWEIKLPWPFSNREYVFERNTYEHKYNDMMFLIADNSSLNNNNTKQEETNTNNINSRTIRITEYEQMTVFYSDREDGRCNVYMEYYDDPKGNIPLVLKNWVVSRAAPNFIMNIEKACKEYKAFEKRLKNNKHIKELNDILGKSLQQAFDDFEL
jgi:hypothetical protein